MFHEVYTDGSSRKMGVRTSLPPPFDSLLLNGDLLPVTNEKRIAAIQTDVGCVTEM